jgi:hypothetical protein
MSVTSEPVQGFKPSNILFHRASNFYVTYTDIISIIFPRKFESLSVILPGNIRIELFTEPLSIPPHSLPALYPVLLQTENKGKCRPHPKVVSLPSPAFRIHVYPSEDDATYHEQSISVIFRSDKL